MSSKIKKQRRLERDKLKPHPFIGGYVKLPDFSPSLIGKEGLGKPYKAPKEQALSQSSVLCQMHLNGDLSFAELFNGLLQVKNKLEREELAEIDSDYKESLKDSFE